MPMQVEGMRLGQYFAGYLCPAFCGRQGGQPPIDAGRHVVGFGRGQTVRYQVFSDYFLGHGFHLMEGTPRWVA